MKKNSKMKTRVIASALSVITVFFSRKRNDNHSGF